MVKKNTYTLGKKFECCGRLMITVIMKGKSACIMSELEYNRIIKDEQKYEKMNKLKMSA